MQSINVLFVCLGNICRSPTAHGVFADIVEAASLDHRINVDSAGTSNWHIDEAPDRRSSAAARARGFDLSALRGRQVEPEDFEKFDYILAMDRDNLANLRRRKPLDYAGTLDLFLRFGSQTRYKEVPDPYGGGDQGSELALDLIEDACHGLLDHIKATNL